jgi:hypothetical protein
MKKSLLLFVILTTAHICAFSQLNSNGGSLLFNENKATSTSARNWAIRQNNSAEGDFAIGYTGGHLSAALPDFSTAPASAKFTIKSSGSIGIGTVSPIAKFDVSTPMVTQGTYVNQAWTTADPQYNLKLQHVWNSNGIHQSFVHRFAGTDYQIMTFSQGRIGIGTLYPTAKLDVQQVFPGPGTIDIQRWGDTNPAYGIKMQGVWDNNGIGFKLVERHSNTEYPAISFFQGKIGIGIANPSAIDARLAVKGTIHCQEVKVDLAGAVAPDYVFEKDYALMPLSNLRNYIDQNKHLPEVPSAADMEKEGVMLKEMNLILLKKVEELTLYILEQEKRIEALEKKN